MEQTLKGNYSSLYGIKNNKLCLISKFKDDYTFEFGIETLLSFKYYIKNINHSDNMLIENLKSFFTIYDDLSSDDKVILNFTLSYYFKKEEINNLIRVLQTTIEIVEDEKYEKAVNEIIRSLICANDNFDGIIFKNSSSNHYVVEIADSSNKIIKEVLEYYEKDDEYSSLKYQ